MPEYDVEAVWQAFMRLRGWQQGPSLLAYYNDPAKRALLKPEAIFEIETGLRLSAYDITAASVVRTAWSQAVRRFFERYDYLRRAHGAGLSVRCRTALAAAKSPGRRCRPTTNG